MKNYIIILAFLFFIGSFAQKAKVKNKKKTFNKTKVYVKPKSKNINPPEAKKNIDVPAESDELQISNVVDVVPEPIGGMRSFYKFVSANFRVPEVEDGLQGKVIVKFVVSKTGEIINIDVLSDPPLV
jgi:hypothetical protein